jgi:hypothetical protein
MSQIFPQSNWVNQVALTTGVDNYTGSSATAGKAGNASPGSRHDQFTLSSRGSSIANSVRVYLKVSSTYTFLFEVPVPARTIVAGQVPAFSQVVPTGYQLPDANTSLAFQLKTTDTGIDITEQGVHF